jgi:hypothetical protein
MRWRNVYNQVRSEKRQYKDALKLLGIDTSNEKREERKLMKRMATAHHKHYSGAAEKAAPPGDSYTFEYDEDKKQLKPVDKGMEQVPSDRAGHGWRKWTRE